MAAGNVATRGETWRSLIVANGSFSPSGHQFSDVHANFAPQFAAGRSIEDQSRTGMVWSFWQIGSAILTPVRVDTAQGCAIT